MSFPYLSTFILSPFIGALILLFVSKERKQAIQLVPAISAAISLVLSITVFIQYDRSARGMQFVENIAWVKSIGIAYKVGVDGISIPMLLLTGIIFFTSVLVSCISIKKRQKEYFISLLMLVAGTSGAFCAINLFFFFFFYELAVLPMFLLIGIWGSPAKEYSKEYGAFKLILQIFSGSTLVLFGIFILFVKTGTLDMVTLSQIRFPLEFQKLTFPVFCLGFGVLAGLWPLHTWSPIGHATAPTAASMLHAGVLMKLGAYGILRVAITLLPSGAKFWLPVVIVMCSIGIVYGALVAMAQNDLKFLIGFSSVSHMGIVNLGLFTLNTVGINGAVFQMFSHGIMTALLFALVGAVYDRTHTRYIDELGGIAIKMPAVAALFALGGFTSAGLPGTSGFVAEFMVFMGAYRVMKLLPILGIIASAIVTLYILRAVRRVFFNDLNPKFENLNNAHPLEFLAFGILTASLILFGFFPSLLTNVINLGVAPLVARIGGAIW